MSDTNDLFYDGRRPVRRERTVRETGFQRVPQQASPDEIYKNRIDLVYRSFADTINAARAVLPYYERMGKKLSIPVDELATDVRTAVRRKDSQTPAGDVITFDLFRDAIENYDLIRANITSQAASSLDGNPPLDAVKIQRIKRKVENGDLDATELAVFSSIFLVRMLLSGLTNQHVIPIVQGMTAPKLMPGTDTGPAIGAIVQSIVLGLLIDIVNEAALRYTTTPRAGGKGEVDYDTHIQSAKSNPQLTRLEEIAIRRIGEGDYQSILEYSINYIANSDDLGYQSWMAYMDSKEIRNRAIQHYQFGPQYSSEQMNLINNIPEPRPVSIIEDTTITTQLPDRNLTPGLLDTVSMSPEHLCTLETRATGLQENLAMIAQVMSSQFAQDFICCLTRFLGKMGQDNLIAMKAILAFAKGLLQEKITINLMKTLMNVLNYLSNSVKDFIVAYLEKTFSTIVDEALSFLDKPDDDWKLIFEGCPLVDTFINIILNVIQQLKSKLIALIEGIGFDGLDFDFNQKDKWSDMYVSRTIKMIIQLIDRVLSSIINEDCSVDEDGNILLSDIVRITQSAVNQDDYTVQFPEALIEKHFPNSKPISLEETGVRPATTIPAFGQQDGADERVIMRSVLEKCGRRVSDQELDKIFKETNGDN